MTGDLDSQLAEALSKLEDGKAEPERDDCDDYIDAASNIIDDVRSSLKLHKGTLDAATAALREQAEDLDQLAGDLY